MYDLKSSSLSYWREKYTETALNLSKHKKTCQWASARPGNLRDFNNAI